MPLLTIAGKKNTLMVLPPYQSLKIAASAGAKCVKPNKFRGSVDMVDAKNMKIARTIAPLVKSVATTLPVSSDGSVTAGKNGAVFLSVKSLDGSLRSLVDVKALKFPFVNVENLPWWDNGCE
ncbi:hypothetical protein DFH08DRAFT_953496 [Mycena albidolilacea]|uniref:Aldos-2-ulose dehydratase/isomerase (AUDH) Cupin domain-containing protein n=1 Tax=Mycena albidolilacea TaxID=1033008 RepID=A0AAD7AGZ6_9AGAR|nr:hypothetical protein DFH08DRAFT_953496 [Mycena albidolilacea]